MDDQEVNVYNIVNDELIPESNVSIDINAPAISDDRFINNIIVVGEQYDVLDSSKRWCEGKVKNIIIHYFIISNSFIIIIY